MNEGAAGLLSQGLVITAWGMGLVFLGLGLLWGLMALLTRVLRPEAEQQTSKGAEEPLRRDATVTEAQANVAEGSAAAALTTERARVAAVVAGALWAHALPWQTELASSPEIEAGSTASSWVGTHRARNLRTWQPPRGPRVGGHQAT